MDCFAEPVIGRAVARYPSLSLTLLIGFANAQPILRRRALMNPHLPCFPAQHRLLAGDAPMIAGQRAAFAERAMAQYHERYRAFSHCGADRAGRLRAV